MTLVEFVAAVRAMHMPYLPTVVSVQQFDPCHPEYGGGEWHDPSESEQAESLMWWCDGCNAPASKCRVSHLLVMVEGNGAT